MQHRPIAVIATMSGPICLRNPLHLDGILLAARERRYGPEVRGRPLDALAMRDGLYQASAGFLVTEGIAGLIEGKSARVRKLDMRGRDGQNIHFESDFKQADRTIGGMSKYRNTLVSEPTFGNVRHVVWQALGDADAILDLLSEISTIGKQHATGWGAVEGFDTAESTAGAEVCGLASEGRPLRNLPLPLARSLGVDCSVTFPGRVEPPYAIDDDAQEVTGPGLAELIGSAAETKRVLQYS